MSQRIYKAEVGGQSRLVRAANQAQVRNHIARDTIKVSVASPDDVYDLAVAGKPVEETGEKPEQVEIGGVA